MVNPCNEYKTYQIHQTNVIQLSIKTLDVFEQNV